MKDIRDLSPLTALSPLDGRYADKASALRSLLSEYGLIRLRVRIETAWLKTLANEPSLSEIPPLSTGASEFLEHINDNFNLEDAERIKQIEQKTQHDTKAIEYFLKEKMASNSELNAIKEFIHFGCTSDDINNLAYALMLKSAREEFLLPTLSEVINILREKAHQYAENAMLGHTHGQAATPTTVGKEFANTVSRLKHQYNVLKNITIFGKFNGAVGNFNAHVFTYPTIDWRKISKQFISQLGLTENEYTTQIEPHDYIAEFCHVLMRCNTILIDFNRDMWGYISLGYFRQQIKEQEIGSSTMPHKVNPIDFENSEGNLGIANALLGYFANHLPISRWQRDLTDSTILRNLGVAIGHSLLGFQSTLRGIQKCVIDEEALKADLDKHWEVLAEPIQTVMRRYGFDKPYEQLKELTRGKKVIDASILREFIEKLDLPAGVKEELLALKPWTYLGNAAKLANNI